MIPSPTRGWGKMPGKTDTAVADDIQRICIYRDMVCHTNRCEMTTQDFNKKVLDIKQVRTYKQKLANKSFKT